MIVTTSITNQAIVIDEIDSYETTAHHPGQYISLEPDPCILLYLHGTEHL